jgi:hypothetical protein
VDEPQAYPSSTNLPRLVSLGSKPSGQAAVDAIEARFKQKIPLRQVQRALQELRIKCDEDHIVDWQKIGPYTELFMEQMMMGAVGEEQS